MTHFCSLPISNSPLLAKFINSNKAINSKEETNKHKLVQSKYHNFTTCSVSKKDYVRIHILKMDTIEV